MAAAVVQRRAASITQLHIEDNERLFGMQRQANQRDKIPPYRAMTSIFGEQGLIAAVRTDPPRNAGGAYDFAANTREYLAITIFCLR